MIRIFRVYLPAGVFALLLSEIVLISLCFLFAAFLVLTEDLTTYLVYDNGWARLGIVVASIIFGFYLMDLYSEIHVKSRMRLLQHLCQVFGIALMVQGLISYASPDLRFGRGIMLVGGLLSLVLLFAWRLLYSAYVSKVVGAERILFAGWTPVVQQIANHLARHPELGVAVQGYLDDSASSEPVQTIAKFLGPVKELRHVAEELQPNRIVVASVRRTDRLLAEDLIDLRFSGFTVQDAASAHEAVFGRLCTEELRPDHLLFAGAGQAGWRPAGLFLHEMISVALGLFLVIIALPLIVITAILVRISSPGPMFTRQVCAGKDGDGFVVNKFRTTRTDASGDGELTPLGAWLRRLRLDALPLLFNVVRGEMSLVGPLPERIESVDALSRRIPYYGQRLCVKPGITSWAELNLGRGEGLHDVITSLEYDLYYIKNISLSLNAYIIIHTLKSVVFARA
ncbi:MAG TPA: sugar transferase [Bryobacteraceae bacterium]|nr:sugar transferase [Bryobacteraceae bacterium]